MIGKRLKLIRQNKKKKVLEVAGVLGLSKSQYLKKESGKHKVTADEIQKLIIFYGVYANYFYVEKVAQ